MSAAGSDVLAVSTAVLDEGGRWTVVLDVVFADGAVRHHVGSYTKRAKAEMAARVLKNAVDREGPGSFGGSDAAEFGGGPR